jgi:spore maturation protein SpmB
LATFVSIIKAGVTKSINFLPYLSRMLCRIKAMCKQYYQCQYLIKLNHIWLQLVL